jgi:glycosyltransferase involved in cell wall biosynthesis
MNLSIQNESLIVDMFKKIRSLDALKEKLIERDKKGLEKVAGVIGSFDENKQTHISIQRAFSEGYEKVYLFGNVTDPNYYEKYVKPLMNENVIEYGFESDKQKIYNMVDAVFLSSKSEVASLVKDECESTGTKFYGNTATDHDVKELTNDEIIKEWIKVLGL